MAETKEENDLLVKEVSSEMDQLFDVMDNEEKTKADTFVKGYCLYKHMTNRLVFVLHVKIVKRHANYSVYYCRDIKNIVFFHIKCSCFPRLFKGFS
jgi:hypothetical protein